MFFNCEFSSFFSGSYVLLSCLFFSLDNFAYRFSLSLTSHSQVFQFHRKWKAVKLPRRLSRDLGNNYICDVANVNSRDDI